MSDYGHDIDLCCRHQNKQKGLRGHSPRRPFLLTASVMEGRSSVAIRKILHASRVSPDSASVAGAFHPLAVWR
jgi:hypothetical protein